MMNEVPTTGIQRIDKYTLLVDGHRVRATPEQEAQIRQMSPDRIRRFLTIMGVTQ